MNGIQYISFCMATVPLRANAIPTISEDDDVDDVLFEQEEAPPVMLP